MGFVRITISTFPATVRAAVTGSRSRFLVRFHLRCRAQGSMWGRGGWTRRGGCRQAQSSACGRVGALLRRIRARVMRGRESGGVFSSGVHNMISVAGWKTESVWRRFASGKAQILWVLNLRRQVRAARQYVLYIFNWKLCRRSITQDTRRHTIPNAFQITAFLYRRTGSQHLSDRNARSRHCIPFQRSLLAPQ